MKFRQISIILSKQLSQNELILFDKILNEADSRTRTISNCSYIYIFFSSFISCSFHFVNDSDKREEGDVACYRRYDVISITHKPPEGMAGSRR